MAAQRAMRISVVFEATEPNGDKSIGVLAGEITQLELDSPAVLSDEVDPLGAVWEHYVPGQEASLKVTFKKTDAVFQWVPIPKPPEPPLAKLKKTKKGKKANGKDR